MSNVKCRWKQFQNSFLLLFTKVFNGNLEGEGTEWEYACMHIKVRCFCPQRVKNMAKEQWAGVRRDCFCYSPLSLEGGGTPCNSSS